MAEARTSRAIITAARIDHTLLRPEATRQDVERACRETARFGFATVCLNPCWVPLAVRELEGSPSRVCTVVGFPLGASAAGVKRYETDRALADGAREVDMVMNLGALKEGDWDLVRREIEDVAQACHGSEALLKVIIEAALLGASEKVAAARAVMAAGADFVKTSTGFGPGGATVEDVRLLRQTVGDRIGVKAAGGVRTLAAFEAMLAAGASRVGTSAGPAIVGEAAAGA